MFPLPIVAGLGGLVMLIALLSKAKDKDKDKQFISTGTQSPARLPVTLGKALTEDSPKPHSNEVPAGVKQVVLRQYKGLKPTKTELEIAASSAAIAGFTRLGDALLERAKDAPDEQKFHKLTSPLPDISDESWAKFVKAMATGKPSNVIKGRYGIFQMGTRRLGDFGIMNNVHKLPDGSWAGDLAIKPDRFVVPRFQYKLFERSMVNYRDAILKRYRDAVRTKLDGEQASLSGLLSVAHFTGIDGLGKWLADPELRKKFKATSVAYKKTNGIF